MRKVLVATLICLSTLALSQPVKADSSRSYKSAYRIIATSKVNFYENQEFRVYILKWLEQDKNYPHKVAISYCESKRSGWSDYQFIDMSYDELMQRKVLENWSESRFKAYMKINTVGAVVGMKHYCPEFLDKDINQ